MNKKPDSMIVVVALGGLIIIGIITTTIINAVKNRQADGDIRAKAGVTSTLKLVGIVTEIKEETGTLTISDVQFEQNSRSGNAVNYGVWTVTPPVGFDIYSVNIGTRITFTIQSDSFNIASKNVTADSIVQVR